MTRKMYVTVLGVVALMASACGGVAMTGPTTTAFVPAGQAAQPGSWPGVEPRVSAPDGAVRGRAAQPGSWVQDSSPAPRQYAIGVSAGRAAQPGSWTGELSAPGARHPASL